MKPILTTLVGALAVALFSHFTFALGERHTSSDLPSVERGRYLVRITGCNDCHTPMYGPRDGNVPEAEWLIGVPVGWKGPWGTTYATNLRNRAAGMSENEWVTFLKNLRSRPPMPFFAVNDLTESDSRSIYRFIRSLGDHPQSVPNALPPGAMPTTPYFNFDVVMPVAQKAGK